MKQKSLGVTLPFNQTLAYYVSYDGEGQKSGAYILRTDGDTPVRLPVLKFGYTTVCVTHVLCTVFVCIAVDPH